MTVCAYLLLSEIVSFKIQLASCERRDWAAVLGRKVEVLEVLRSFGDIFSQKLWHLTCVV